MRSMKYLSALIKLKRPDSINKEPQRIEVNRLTTSSTYDFGVQGGYLETEEMNSKAKLLQKIRLEVSVNDDFLQPTIEAIKRGSISKDEENVGNGKVFMLPLEDITRIGTNENGIILFKL